MESAPQVIDLSARRHAADLRETWQGRALAHAKGKLSAVVLSILAHNYDDALPVLLRVVFPGFTTITAPFYCTAARVAYNGAICAHMIDRDGRMIRNSVVFLDAADMQAELRKLADAIKTTDAERVELFAAAKRWVVADFRLDPRMAPQDPDARRLTLN